MTAVDIRITRRHLTAPAVWSGRVLSGVVGGFLAIEGLSRLVWGRALVPASEAALALTASAQGGLGAAVLVGVALHILRPTLGLGTGLLTVCLSSLVVMEARADAPSPSHLMFWAYVGLLILAAHTLRRGRIF